MACLSPPINNKPKCKLNCIPTRMVRKIKKAMYRRKVIKAGRTIEVEETYPTQFGDNLTRKRHDIDSDGTPAAMEAYNEEVAIRKLTRILNENYVPDDYWLTFHYEKHNRPDSYDKANKVLSSFIPKLRKLYQNEGIELKYVKCTAFGERGGVHHHLVIPQGVPQKAIRDLWKEHIKATIKARPPDFTSLYSTGEYSAIAAYIVKQKRCIEGGNERYIKKWVASRNLKKPEEEKIQDIEKIKWDEPPTAYNGYYIDTDSIRAGCNPITGRPYLFYRMVKLPPNFVCYNNEGKRLTGKEAVKWYRHNNREYIKQNWFELNPEGEVIFKEGIRQNE